MKQNPKITQRDIRRAIRNFEQRGRLIRKLPEQIVPRLHLVGARHGAYENPTSTTARVEQSRQNEARERQ